MLDTINHDPHVAAMFMRRIGRDVVHSLNVSRLWNFPPPQGENVVHKHTNFALCSVRWGTETGGDE